MTTARYVLPKPTQKSVIAEVDRIAQIILTYAQPLKIYLIGSAIGQDFDAESDLDFVVIFLNEEQVKQGYSLILNNIKERVFPIDLICLSEKNFKEKKDIGGISFEAFHHGKLLFEKQETQA